MERFQSHAGSIEARHSARLVIANFEFQSHAGSIEADRTHKRTTARGKGFNPTLVRLRRILRDFSRTTLGGFNPTLVRLRRFAKVVSVRL